MATYPGMVDRTCVIPSEDKTAGFSAEDRSEMYSLGIISETGEFREGD